MLDEIEYNEEINGREAMQKMYIRFRLLQTFPFMRAFTSLWFQDCVSFAMCRSTVRDLIYGGMARAIRENQPVILSRGDENQAKVAS